MNRPARTALRGGTVLLSALGAVHAAPALSTFGPLRNRLMPGLAGRGRPDHIALTFDDGPDYTATPFFLRLLDANRIHATFFLLASMAARSPGVVKEIAAAGHEIGVHGWTHRPLLLNGTRATHDRLSRARDLIADITGEPPVLFRPPYGIMTTAGHLTCHRLGLTPVLWTAWGEDWRSRATPRSIHDTAARDLTGGATLLLHDSDCTSATGSWRRTLAALPAIIETCHTRGWRLGPLRDHGVPGVRNPGGGFLLHPGPPHSRSGPSAPHAVQPA